MACVSFVNASASENNNDVTVVETGDTRIVTDNTLNESVVVVFEDESKTKGTIHFPDYTISQIMHDQGNIYLDGQMIIKSVVVREQKDLNVATRATTWIQGATL